MKTLLLVSAVILSPAVVGSTSTTNSIDHSKDFDVLIGIKKCQSTKRISKTEWAAPVSTTWEFKHIMGGTAVQDNSHSSDGIFGGNIRQYDAEKKHWYVHYYNSASVTESLKTWVGKKEGDDLVFRRDSNAPNGMEGFYRLTFHNITPTSYDWKGEWIDKAKTIVYPTWKISCKK